MTKKIFKNVFLSCFAVLVASIVIIFGVMYDFYGNELMNALSSEIDDICVGVEQNGILYLNNLDLERDKRITWINSDGSVKYDSDATVDKMENHLNRQEIKDAILNGKGMAVRNSDTLSEKTMYCAKLMKDGTIIRVSTNQYTVWVLLLNMFQPLAIIIVISLVLSYAAAYFASKKIVRPINELNLEDAHINSTYEEIRPLVDKIHNQNVVIKMQIKELKRTQAEFSAITKNMKEGFLVVDQQGKILSFNDSAKKILEITKITDINGVAKPFSDYVKSSIYGEHIAEIIEHKDSCYEFFSNPVLIDDMVKGAVAVILDVTEKHHREFLRREFSANVSHELKTPLAGILASAEVIAMDNTTKENDIHFSKNIIKETNRLITLVNDIIKLSKLESNSLELITENVDIYCICKNVVERLAPIAEVNDISLNLIGEKSVVSGVSAILDEIVYNLVDNAIKYNKKGGKVNITIAPIDGKTTLVVEDTGIGISEENKDRIFERFYRVDKSHSKEVGGTGLGLSIVKHGVEHHNGKLNIESELGKGTKITVIL